MCEAFFKQVRKFPGRKPCILAHRTAVRPTPTGRATQDTSFPGDFQSKSERDFWYRFWMGWLGKVPYHVMSKEVLFGHMIANGSSSLKHRTHRTQLKELHLLNEEKRWLQWNLNSDFHHLNRVIEKMETFLSMMHTQRTSCKNGYFNCLLWKYFRVGKRCNRLQGDIVESVLFSKFDRITLSAVWSNFEVGPTLCRRWDHMASRDPFKPEFFHAI